MAPAPGDEPTFVWMVLIHVSAVVGLILFPLPGLARRAGGAGRCTSWAGSAPPSAFHRALAHKSVKLHPVVRNVLTFFAMMNGSGSPLSWAANHRLHHAKSDTPEDISSPRVGGFWWSHLRWLWQAGAAPIKQYCKEHRHARATRFGRGCRSAIAGAARLVRRRCRFGWAAFFWLGRSGWCGRCTRSASSTASATCAQDAGPDEATAQNVRWLALMHFFQGENWHQNHHDRPGSARLGWTPAQLDVGWYTILLLEKVGLATDVRRPTSTRDRSTPRPESARGAPAPLAAHLVGGERDRGRQVQRAQLGVEHGDGDGRRGCRASSSGGRPTLSRPKTSTAGRG